MEAVFQLVCMCNFKSFHYKLACEPLEDDSSRLLTSRKATLTSLTIIPFSLPFAFFHVKFFSQFLSVRLFSLSLLLHLYLLRGGQEVVLRL